METNLRGTSLREDDIRSGKVLTTEWRGKIDYTWDAGAALGQFLAGLKECKLLGRQCHGCQRIMIPPRMFCEKCFRQSDAWVELKDTGRVNTFSVSFVNWDASRRTTPQVPAVVARRPTTSSISCSVISPARKRAQKRRQSVHAPSLSPR